MTLHHLHIGVVTANVEMVTSYFSHRQNVRAVHLDGDGWNVWGEPMDEDDNVPGVHHIIVEFESKYDWVFMDACTFLVRGGFLVRADRRGTLWAITDADMWSACRYAFEINTGDAAPDEERSFTITSLTGKD